MGILPSFGKMLGNSSQSWKPQGSKIIKKTAKTGENSPSTITGILTDVTRNGENGLSRTQKTQLRETPIYRTCSTTYTNVKSERPQKEIC